MMDTRLLTKVRALCDRSHLLLTGLSGLLSFVVLTNNASDVESPVELRNYSGTLWLGSSLVSLTLIIPILSNVVLDWLKGFETKTPKSDNPTIDIHTTSESALFQLGMMFPVITPFLPISLTLIHCCFRAHIGLVLGTIFAAKYRYDPKFATTWVAMVFYLLLIVSNALFPFTLNSNLTLAAFIMQWAAIAIFLICLGPLLFLRTWVACRRVVRPTAASPVGSVRDQVYMRYRKAYLTCVGFWIFFKLFVPVNSIVSSHISVVDYDLFLYNVPSIIFQIFFLVLSMRMVRYEAISSLASLLEAKNEYVRYISHEMRSPLSAGTSGLQVLQQELKAVFAACRGGGGAGVEGVYDTLNDIALAITTSVDILNDLLTFDKIQAGAMELHKGDVSVMTFIQDCCGIFNSQARAKSIRLLVLFNDDDVVEKSMPIQETDLIRFDKFKISQVVRNFISNALKFTPVGGRVVVRVSFVPCSPDAALLGASSARHSARHTDADRGEHGCGCGWRLLLPRRGRGRFHRRNVAFSSHGSGRDGFQLGMLRISVMDSGVGISAADQERLFKGVVQFNPDKLQAGGGSGFGLLICKGIIDLHHGKIDVFSEGEGKGSTFSIQLPMWYACVSSRRSGNAAPAAINCHLSAIVAHNSRLQLQMNEAPIMPSASAILDSHHFQTSDSSLRVAAFGSIGLQHTCSNREDAGPLDDPSHLDAMDIATSVKNVIPPSRVQASEVVAALQATVSETCALVPPPALPYSWTILVVDDSALNRKMLTKLFKSVGQLVEEAVDGQEAVRKVQQRLQNGLPEYDAILMDFMMPVMNGPTATRVIRELGYLGRIFGVTGNGTAPDVQKFMDSGVNRVLVKPFTIADFQSAIVGDAMFGAINSNDDGLFY